jgi:hypothetical protein
LDSASAVTPALPIVETVSDDDSVLAGDATCATSADTASVTTHYPIFWYIRVVTSDIPDAPPDPDFAKYFVSSSISRVHQLEEVDAFDTDDMIFDGIDGIDGIDPRVMTTFDHHVPGSAPIHYDDLGALDHQVKAISTAPHRFADILRRSGDSTTKYYATIRTKDPDVFGRVKFGAFASVGFPDSNEALVTLFHEKRTNADVTIGSYLRGGLLYGDLLILPDSNQRSFGYALPREAYQRRCNYWLLPSWRMTPLR